MRKPVIIAGSVLLAAAAVCAGIGIYKYMQQKDAGKQYEELREEVKDEEPEPEHPAVEIPIDFASLQAKNPEIYAWITIPGTAIDYPVVQSASSNEYYLTHTVDHTESPEGAIFTENYNSTDFEDPNTVIYGHDMKNGTMFQNLLNYQDRTFFDANREVLIYTPDAIRHYQIFAAYLYDDRHLMLSFDFKNEEIYSQYLASIFSMRNMTSCIDTSQEVSADDRIITLSTCYGNQSDKRYLVQAVLVSIEQ